MCKMKSTPGKSIDLEVTNDNFKYSMCNAPFRESVQFMKL